MMPDSATIKEVGRRRVFAFFWGLLLVAIANTISEERDIFLHVVDDYADIILAVIAIAILVAWRKRNTLTDLKKTNAYLTVLAVGVILATLFAISQEYNDPADFGNEIPTLLFGIFLLVNRFV